MLVTYSDIESKINGSETFWEDENIVVFDSSVDGYLRVDGMFRNGNWGIRVVINMTDDGKYVIPRKYEQIFQ